MKTIPHRKISLSKIKFDEDNPNKLTDEQRSALAKVVKEYGFAQDVWVNDNKDGTYTVIDGEHRVKLLQDNKESAVECRVFDIKQVDVKILRQVANKLRGRHDGKQDSAEFKYIFESGKLDDFADMLAQEKAVFEAAMRENYDMFNEDFEESDQIELTDDPMVKLGDVVELGEHRIMCGDCTVKENYDKLFGDKKASSINTDPPYAVNYGENKTRLSKRYQSYKTKKITTHQYENDTSDIKYDDLFEGIISNTPLEEYNTIYIWIAGAKLFEIVDGLRRLQKIGPPHILTWIKNNFSLSSLDYKPKTEFCIYTWLGKHKFYGERDIRKIRKPDSRHKHRTGGKSISEHPFKTDVYEYPKPRKNALHPTMKPIEMIRSQIEDGTRKGEIVFDAFLGSGTTLIAAERSQRVCYGMELDPRFVDVIIRRWASETKTKQVIINGKKVDC